MDQRDDGCPAPSPAPHADVALPSPETEEPVVIGVREIVRFTGRTSGGVRATTGSMLRLLD